MFSLQESRKRSMLSFNTAQTLLAVAIASSALLSKYSEQIRDYALGRPDMRVYLSQDEKDRTETIAFRNDGFQRSEPIIIRLKTSTKNISDFDWAPAEDAPRVSFLGIAELDNSLRQAAGKNGGAFLRAVDEHSLPTSLIELDDALNDIFRLRATATTKQPGMVDVFMGAIEKNHSQALRECDPDYTDPNCRIEEEYERWEHDLRSARKEAEASWQEATGLSVNFDRDYFGPVGEISFMSRIAAGETGFLTIHFGPGSTSAKTEVVKARHQYVVAGRSGLDASGWWLAVSQHPVRAVGILSVLLVVGFLVRPATSLPTHEVFSKALKACAPDEDPLWEVAYSKTQFFLPELFREFRSELGVPEVHVTKAELFENVRDRLRLDYALKEIGKFDSAGELEEALRHYMRQLVQRTLVSHP